MRFIIYELYEIFECDMYGVWLHYMRFVYINRMKGELVSNTLYKIIMYDMCVTWFSVQMHY